MLRLPDLLLVARILRLARTAQRVLRTPLAEVVRDVSEVGGASGGFAEESYTRVLTVPFERVFGSE